MRGTRSLLLLVVVVAALVASARSQTELSDADRDGLSDQLEQTLLEQFRPTFYVSTEDCDLLPAEFTPGVSRPIVLRRNGTIYGQASRSTRSTPQTDVIELHYYHLWGSDCGRRDHPLDVEHVSALLERPTLAPRGEPWRATYWYAASHQETVCDKSTGARAATLEARDKGPVVWVSHGKHASYFDLQDCSSGCGSERCQDMKQLSAQPLINLGEPDAPMHDAAWIASAEWPLSQRMRSDFDDRIIAAIDAQPGQIARLGGQPSAQTVILAGNKALGGIGVGQQHTGGGLSVATRHTWKSLKTSFKSVKKALTNTSSTPKEN